jgi:tetratricopeptide (TPR) repeat protein
MLDAGPNSALGWRMFQIIVHMRTVLTVLLLVLSGAALAQDKPTAADYETLLTSLSHAKTQTEADQLSNEIWQIWLTAPDDAAQAVLDAAMERRQAHDFLGAIKELDVLVAHYPDYAEGWNQRATVRFLRGELDASLADVAEVLKREPRHFGALSGKALILYRQGKIPLAQIAVREALKHHPFLRERSILQAAPGTDL